MIIFINGFLIYYLLSILLLENGEVGPKIFSRQTVIHDNGEDTWFWESTVVDYLRRVMFVYEFRRDVPDPLDKGRKVWYVRDNQMSQLWNCPKCMSLWLALILSIFFKNDILITLFENDILNVISAFILSSLASAGVGVFLYDITSQEDSNVSP